MTNSDKSYLIYMAVRLLEMQRLLKPTGSIYLHCDPTMSHYLKLVMDAIFGRENFKNDIIWNRSGGFKRKTARLFPTKNDNILFYALDSKIHTFSTQYRPHRPEYIKRFKADASGRLFRSDVNPTGGGRRTIYLDETLGDIVDSVWIDIPPANPAAKERVGYPTQKPIALLRRILKASCPENGVVLDPFCGCATTCVAAEELSRQWVGIDISSKAYDLVKDRMDREIGFSTYTCPHRTDIPQRTDIQPLKRYNHPDNRKYLYGEQGGICNGCREHFLIQNFTVDHIISRKQGGTDHLDNLQLLCARCNSVKGDRGQEYLITRLAA